MTRDALVRRLLCVEALEAAATTPGEKTAASRAKKRIAKRISQMPKPRAYWKSREPFIEPLLLGEEMPTRQQVTRWITRWRSGAVTNRRIQRWASRILDKTLMPDLPPQDPQSTLVEVIFELAGLHQWSWGQDDVDALLAFLEEGLSDSTQAWKQWFAHVETTRGWAQSA